LNPAEPRKSEEEKNESEILLKKFLYIRKKSLLL
jgi:hypothetical protein